MEVNGKIEAARLGGAAATVTGFVVTLNDVVAVVTILYLIVQMLVLMPKAINSVRVLRRKYSQHHHE